MKQQSISKQSVQHGRSKTRNQRKREFINTLLMSIVALLMSVMVLTMMVKAWAEHPAEQSVDGRAYLESIQSFGGGSND